MKLLGPSLRAAKATDDGGRPPHDAGVRREHHIRQVRLRIDELHARTAFELHPQRVPLRDGAAGVDSADLRLHPGIDGVVDAEMPRGAQQYPRRRFCRFGQGLEGGRGRRDAGYEGPAHVLHLLPRWNKTSCSQAPASIPAPPTGAPASGRQTLSSFPPCPAGWSRS